MPLTRARRAFVTASTFAFLALATAPAYAAGSNMPWEQPLTRILGLVQGPVAKVISVVITSSPVSRWLSAKPPAYFGV